MLVSITFVCSIGTQGLQRLTAAPPSLNFAHEILASSGTFSVLQALQVQNSSTGADQGDAPDSMNSDEVLMREFQLGSRPAFEELYSRYNGPLYGFFRRRLESPQRAEDLAQETFLAVIRGAQRYEPRALVRTYLYAIALKLLAAERRKQHRDGPDIETIAEPSRPSAQESGLWVREALAKLDLGDREILMLREYEQLSYSEIAELLRVPVNTVRSRLFRARMSLKDHLNPKMSLQTKAPSSASGAASTTAAAEGEA
jgi:RNA polymerase sigma-70 factor (ECF subfamily)